MKWKWKKKRTRLKVPCVVLAIRHDNNDLYFIGTPNQMFEFNPSSTSERRRACILYGITDETLTQFVTEAERDPGKLALLAL